MQRGKRTQTLILTHPFMGNYGGMLQAYALQRALGKVGVEALLIDYGAGAPLSPAALWENTKCWLRTIQLFSGLTTARTPIPWNCMMAVGRAFKRFCSFSRPLHPQEFRDALGQVERFIVGSDQVWRASRVRQLLPVSHYFLGFASPAVRRQSMAYAASFAVDEWEGTAEETEACRRLLSEFKAVSVREESGISLCREVFGAVACRMPDPSFLLEAADYADIIRAAKPCRGASPYVAAYLLDETPGALRLLQAVANEVGAPVQHLTPHAGARQRRERFPLTVPQWLCLLQEAACVVTDSFHGCVFAILFNKPFVCLGNAGRGKARFDTLLQTYGLESRYVEEPQQALAALREPIDWEAVNSARARERAQGLAFLKENLLPASLLPIA